MRQLETSSLSNQDIHAYLLAHTYTADADRAIFARIHLDQVAGGGDYSIYATIQAAGTGSAYMEGPITTFTVPASQTSIGFISILIPVNNTDVVKFYVKGLAGDTSTPDIVTRIFELTYIRPTVNGRTLDIAATGEVGLDFANINAASSPTTLTNITVPNVTDLLNNLAKYSNGCVWVNSVTGASGTVNYVNGIATNPSDTLANAKIIADSLKLKRFWIQAGSSLNLNADMVGYVFDGFSYSFTLTGNRDLSGSTIRGCENLTGQFKSTTNEFYFYTCQIGNVTVEEVDMHDCHIVGTITFAKANVHYLLNRCVGINANSPTVDFGGVADSRSSIITEYGGSLTIKNMRAGNVLSIDGDCDLTIDNTNTGGTVYIMGNVRLTNNGSGQTIIDSARFAEDQSIASVTNDVSANLTKILGTSLTETVGGYLATGFKKLLDVASPVFTLASKNQSADNDTKISTIQADYARRTGDYSTLTAAQVWNALVSSLTTSGSIGAWILDKLDVKVSSVSIGSVPTLAQIWSYRWRTLSTNNGQVVVEVDTIQANTYNTYYQELDDLGSLTNYTSIYFTVKTSKKDLDAASILQIKKNASGVGDGLLTVLSNPASDPTKASLSILDMSSGNITITVDDTIMSQLQTGKYFADVKIIRSVGIKSEVLREYSFILSDTPTKAIS